jgi:hypothetical protein
MTPDSVSGHRGQPDLYVKAVAAATVPSIYLPPPAFADDRYRAAVIRQVEGIAERFGLCPADLRYLSAEHQIQDAGELVLEQLGERAEPQPLYVTRSGGEPDPFISSLASLTHRHSWVRDELVLTHLESLAGSAVFAFLAWAITPAGATVLMLDKPPMMVVGKPVPMSTAVGVRIDTAGGGTRVSGWGVGAPPQGTRGVRLEGTRSCDAWHAFASAVTDGQVAAGDHFVLHTRDDVQEGWVTLEVVTPPAWSS